MVQHHGRSACKIAAMLLQSIIIDNCCTYNECSTGSHTSNHARIRPRLLISVGVIRARDFKPRPSLKMADYIYKLEEMKKELSPLLQAKVSLAI